MNTPRQENENKSKGHLKEQQCRAVKEGGEKGLGSGAVKYIGFQMATQHRLDHKLKTEECLEVQ